MYFKKNRFVFCYAFIVFIFIITFIIEFKHMPNPISIVEGLFVGSGILMTIFSGIFQYKLESRLNSFSSDSQCTSTEMSQLIEREKDEINKKKPWILYMLITGTLTTAYGKQILYFLHQILCT